MPKSADAGELLALLACSDGGFERYTGKDNFRKNPMTRTPAIFSASARAASFQRIGQGFARLKADLYAYFITGYHLRPSDQALALHEKIQAALPELSAQEKALLAFALLRPTEYYTPRAVEDCQP